MQSVGIEDRRTIEKYDTIHDEWEVVKIEREMDIATSVPVRIGM